MSGALPLAGVRVVDLAQVFAGPACTRILADLGADVVRFESAGRMDVTRNLIITDNDGKDHHWHRASYFIVRNAGKREMVLDLAKEQGREVFRQLVAGADVVVESFTPRVMANFGLGYEQLRAIKPDLIMCSLSGYGQSGPMRDFGAYGMGLEPASGISSITGYAGGPPIRSGLSFTDPYSGFVAAGAVLAALHYRRRTGKGQYIDLSEQEAAIPIMGAALLQQQLTARTPERTGDRSPWAAPQGCYRCAGDDRWAVISVSDDAEFTRMAEAMGHAEWAQDARFATVLARHERHDELDALISAWTATRDHYDVFHALQAAGVKAAPVLDGKEILFDEQFRARGHFDVVEQPLLGKRPVQRHLAAKFTRFEARARPRAAAGRAQRGGAARAGLRRRGDRAAPRGGRDRGGAEPAGAGAVHRDGAEAPVRPLPGARHPAGAGSRLPRATRHRGMSAAGAAPWLRPLVLAGRHVRLEPITLDHVDALFDAGQDGAIWRWMPSWPRRADDMRAIVAARLAAQARGEGLTWATVRLPEGDVVGSTSYLNASAVDRRVEIGFTWIATRAQRTALNTEAKYLQLRHAFEALGCLRVELKTDARNQISQRAIERLGAVREGVLRKHMRTQDGVQRDSVYFGITDDEWPAVKARLEAMLGRAD